MLELTGLLAGLAAGYFSPWTIPSQYSLYVAGGLLAALDSALGGLRARLKGEFELGVFLSGTAGNAAIATFLTWVGQNLGIPLYLAAVVVFGTRMFQNFAEIRRELLTWRKNRDKIKRHVQTGKQAQQQENSGESPV